MLSSDTAQSTWVLSNDTVLSTLDRFSIYFKTGTYSIIITVGIDYYTFVIVVINSVSSLDLETFATSIFPTMSNSNQVSFLIGLSTQSLSVFETSLFISMLELCFTVLNFQTLANIIGKITSRNSTEIFKLATTIVTVLTNYTLGGISNLVVNWYKLIDTCIQYIPENTTLTGIPTLITRFDNIIWKNLKCSENIAIISTTNIIKNIGIGTPNCSNLVSNFDSCTRYSCGLLFNTFKLSNTTNFRDKNIYTVSFNTSRQIKIEIPYTSDFYSSNKSISCGSLENNDYNKNWTSDCTFFNGSISGEPSCGCSCAYDGTPKSYSALYSIITQPVTIPAKYDFTWVIVLACVLFVSIVAIAVLVYKRRKRSFKTIHVDTESALLSQMASNVSNEPYRENISESRFGSRMREWYNGIYPEEVTSTSSSHSTPTVIILGGREDANNWEIKEIESPVSPILHPMTLPPIKVKPTEQVTKAEKNVTPLSIRPPMRSSSSPMLNTFKEEPISPTLKDLRNQGRVHQMIKDIENRVESKSTPDLRNKATAIDPAKRTIGRGDSVWLLLKN